jgi:hypothetical protein
MRNSEERCTTTTVSGTLSLMPTARPRIQVTETPPVERALQVAAQRWPGAARSDLVTKLLELGASALDESASGEVARRRSAVELTAGILDDVYEPGYLEELRREWPE